MDWIQFCVFLIANIAFTLTMWLWSRSESRGDHRQLQAWTQQMISSIHEEMKDFHGKLCTLDERTKK